MYTIKPIKTGCNLSCNYCFEANTREAGFNAKYDINNVLLHIDEVVDRHHQPPDMSLHGGEATLLPKDDFEAILAKVYERTGKSSIQTNGLLLDDDHKAMFKKYNTSVGISLDGPWPLNRLRTFGSEERTKAYTEKVIKDIFEMAKDGIDVGVIIVLHQVNGGREAVPILKEWIKELRAAGISGRLNPAFFEGPQKEALELSNEDLTYLYKELWDVCYSADYSWNPYADTRNLILSHFERPDRKSDLLQSVTCAWLGCDPFHTFGEIALYGDGSEGNCARLLMDGDIPLRAPTYSNERELILSQTPWYAGGCQGCAFFEYCKGQCPAEGMEADWRNRSRFCETWYFLLFEWQRRLLDAGVIPSAITDIAHPSEIDVELALGRESVDEPGDSGVTNDQGGAPGGGDGGVKVYGYPPRKLSRCTGH